MNFEFCIFNLLTYYIIYIMEKEIPHQSYPQATIQKGVGIGAGQVYLVLDNIRSKENVGSIFRTADAVGVKKIFLCGITPQPKNFQYQVVSSKYQGNEKDKIAKTALGAETWVPWEYQAQTWRLLERLRDEGLELIALEQTKNSKNIFKYKVPKNKKIALVLGNEVRGLSPKILKYCDEVVHIPMYGKKESLNVAVAAGVALYHIKLF